MTDSRLGCVVQAWLLGIAVCAACNKSDSTDTPKPGISGSGPGICQASCARDCNNDRDCDLAKGIMCCDFHTAGKACTQAAQCPLYCASDSECDTSGGLACYRTTLSVPDKTCQKSVSASALRTCQGDSDCAVNNLCCTIYKEGVCLSPTRCPKACTDSSDCNTSQGEICCTTASLREPNLAASGLCLNPKVEVCPRACKQSSECNSTVGGICCGGVCSTSCEKSCTQNSDCNGQFCCHSALTRLPPATHFFVGGGGSAKTGCADAVSAYCAWIYRCGGTSALLALGVSSLAQCQSMLGVGSCASVASGCPSGESYHADQAQQCAAAFSAYDCSRSDIPASCDLICQ